MFVVFWLYETVFCSSKVLLVCFAVMLIGLTLGGIISWRLQQSGYILVAGILGIGAHLLVISGMKISIVRIVTYLGVMLCTCAFAYGFALVFVGIRGYIIKRKKEREKVERAVCYTLPASKNEYIRNRLHTVLREEEKENEEPLNLSFSWAWRTVLRLQNAKLSLTERLEVERLTNLLSQYKRKQSFATEDVLLLNDAFSKLMKLSAKYNVSVKD